MIAIIPLLRAMPELGDISVVLTLMTLYNHDDAREKLIQCLREHCGPESVPPILRAFDTYSV
jgi:hypothetical protein